MSEDENTEMIMAVLEATRRQLGKAINTATELEGLLLYERKKVEELRRQLATAQIAEGESRND